MNRAQAIASIRARLRAGQSSIGSWIQIPHASIAEIMGAAGYDWVALDLEHGSIAAHQLPELCRALELGGTLPLARVAEGTAKDCKQALDAGCGGIIAPMVESAEQLKRIGDACRWPPAGGRGVGFARANLFGERFDEYAKEAQAPLLVAMIEHGRAVERLTEIVRVEGLDAILVGPYDLSASLGRTAQFTHPEFESTMARILEIARAAGVPCGVHVVAPSRAELERR
ncbi:MAG TPA: aldolase/citrate lyase family protein, partial [Gammaproteobacteria bacterium]|nr:aldolase/citrate lyase family protein [Gammaproteobacteria bacterium]